MANRLLFFVSTVAWAATPPVEISFERDVLSLLTTKGCNGSSCHGSPAGQNGFKLSLYGADAAADHAMITTAHNGRRIDGKQPENSLLLRKPSLQVAHGGGHLLTAASDEYQILLQWLRQGAKRVSSGPGIVSIEVQPREAIVRLSDAPVQLKVVGTLSDGSKIDLTRQVRYAVNDEGVVSASAEGVVTAKGHGLTVLMARGVGKAATAQFIVAGKPPAPAPNAAEANFIDREVNEKLRQVAIEPYPRSSDATFVRRVFLDLIGVLPTVEETGRFVDSTSTGKRQELIDELLNRPEYTSHWLVKFEDWFRNSQYYSQGRTNASFKRWLADAIRADKPYNQTVREMITATGDTTVHPAGNFWHPAIDFMLKTFEVSKATPTVTRLFLGQRIECAECHNHPLENLTQDDFYGMAAFLGRMKVKHGYAQYRRVWFNTRDGEVIHPNTKQPVAPKFLDGTKPEISGEKDRREVLADWILGPQAQQFARATVNRIWAQYFTAGIVHPADDFRSTNMASHPALLDRLAAAFIEGGYRLKPVHRLILNSETYQRASRAPGRSGGSDPLERVLLARYEPRKLPAEVLLDALGQATGVPQTFGNYPPGTSAKDLVATIGATYFLTTFGLPRRDTMEPRAQDPSLAQALHLMNAEAVREKVESPANVLSALLERTIDDRQVTASLYLRALSRPPSEKESTNVEAFLAEEKTAGRGRRRAFENVLWALLNTREFQINQ
ncbi:MAG: DUF1553 domain-containing protein [Acidobacteria bacterium]|nr:DUF1553 domain-containing protein [Acidobacteriota bacterium]